MKTKRSVTAGLLALVLSACAHSAPTPAASSESSARAADESHAATGADSTAIRDGFVTSADGMKIHFREGGRGNVTLFFLHGWLGNAHWWDEQLAKFGARYRVVAMDLAGHGESGRNRKAWTLQASAEDARAVADKLGLERIVWIGHSMCGKLIVEIANRMPERTVSLVPIDSLQDFEQTTREEMDRFFGPLEKDFVPNAQTNFKNIFVPSSPGPVVRRVLDGVATAPPESSIATLRAVFEYDVASAVRNVKAPIVAVNSDREPTSLEANRKLAPRFDVILMKSVGHWPMLERPGEFDQLLQQAIDRGASRH